MDADNLTKQIEEVEALCSIYGEDWTTESEATRSYNIKIKENDHEVILYVTMPSEYPAQAPPKYELSAPWMDRKEKEKLHQSLDEVYLENVGETVIYQWVEKIREKLLQIKPKENKKITNNIHVEELLDLTEMVINCPEITHGEVIVDRKSSFQGHAAEVHSIDDINAVLAKLKQNKKILNATHNMYAYRIERSTEKGVSILQDCDDDGEAHAGGRMLHLLQILDQKNTLVVVSRWYGGIQLGPDRFRHINNATRQVIQQAGLLKK
ncbi:PREDICTED: protein IMPACT-like [Papilio xuthus]|uniref:Protein IMPACT-B n=1 Tax=Papilio xuthus TaxID=66420 RepID=A0A194PWI8_PAPXU|nr:PREDICTED: protein IMPACT-like [Papilio xuthus]KPI97736.1 Protein IMPACT-B [Papilio xuthus]